MYDLDPWCTFYYAQNPLDTFPRNFPVDGEVANLLPTCWQQVVVIEFGKRHHNHTTDTADLLWGSRQLATDLLRGNWCNGFWPLPYEYWTYSCSAMCCNCNS